MKYKYKYIRTKDGIYETTNMRWCECSTQASYYKDDNYMLYVPLEECDTIEELCDELVVHNPSNDGDFYPKHFVYRNKWETMLKPMSDYQKSKGIEVYGAIWTDKGLIYVAKMNDKGELELL